MSIKDITIVITTFKSDETIKNCLDSINSKCKVLLIENSNDTDFKRKIEEEFLNVECILTGKNLGYGSANNIGLKKVKTKYALILNPDTYLETTTLDEFFKAINTIENFAIIGPYIQENNKKSKKVDLENLNLKVVENVKGFAMFMNLSEFKDIGFFDEDFFIYFEEIDLCRRVIKSKKKIYLIPSIKINHSGGQSHNSSINKEMELSRNWHWMWSTFNYHKKHKGFIFALMKVFNKLFSGVLKFLIYLILFNTQKRNIYYQRCSGIINAIRGNKSWYRPKV